MARVAAVLTLCLTACVEDLEAPLDHVGAEAEAPGDSAVGSLADGMGRLQILLHDAPDEAVDEVWVTFDEVSVHGAGGWLVLDDSLRSVDLLSLQDGVVEELALSDLEAGSYQQIRLHLADAWVVVDGETHPLDVPSGTTSGLKLGHGFEVADCGTTVLVLDWDVGAHLTSGPQGYKLRPVVDLEEVRSEGGCSDADADGWTIEQGDCDDADPSRHPGALEWSDGVDNDCDGVTDEATGASDAQAKLVGEGYGGVFDAYRHPSWNGDWDGDGLPDLVVHSSGSDSNGGLVSIVPGTTRGVAAMGDGVLTVRADPDDRIGSTAGGDLNGDGHDDLLVGSIGNSGGPGYLSVFYGPRAGALHAVADADAVLRGAAWDQIGADPHLIDLDPSDGHLDVLVGGQGIGIGPSFGGAAYLYEGPLQGNVGRDDFAVAFVGEAYADASAYADSPGDLDGDGTDDLVVGSHGVGPPTWGGHGAVYFVYDPASYSGVVSLAQADAKLVGSSSSDHISRCGSPGDLDGDGNRDVSVWTHRGLHLLDGVPPAAGLLADAAWARITSATGGFLLSASQSADIDGDGIIDLLVADSESSEDAHRQGRAYVIPGPIPAGTWSVDELAVLTLRGEAPGDQFGAYITSPGDADGDGLDDLLIGAHQNDEAGTDAGAAYLLLGSSL